MKQKVFFATPTYDYQFSADYVSAMMQTAMHLTHLGIDVQAKFVGGLCFVDLARNDLVKFFLETDCTDLFFVDADVGFDYRVVPRFLEYSEEIVGGMVPKKWDRWPYHDNAFTGNMQGPLMESLELPTAFMRIKRHVFEVLDEAYPYYKEYNTMERGRPYFQSGYVKSPEHGKVEFMGEDIFFCRQWCRLGEKVWIDPNVDFSHRGSFAWRGNHMEACFKEGKLLDLREPKKEDTSAAA